MSQRLADVRVRVEPEHIRFSSGRRLTAWLERLFHRHQRFLPWIHGGMFVFFLALLIVPLYLPLPGDRATVLNNFTLLANYLIWGLWFPLVFVSVIFTGRSWCGVLCPMGAASEWANRAGRQRPVPRWIRSPFTPIASFLIITILGQTVGVRDYPQAIAEVFGITLLAALAVGYLYGRGRNKRAWCRHMCPIGLMLGVFSRIGAVQFTPKQPRAGGDAYTEKGVCPTMIDINRKAESRHCVQCFRCVNPEARGGLAVILRRPGTEIEKIRSHNPNAAEIWFLFLATGLSLGGFLWLVLPQYQWLRQTVGAWLINHGLYWIGTPGPAWLMSVHPAAREVFVWLDFFMIVGFMVGCMLLFTAALTGATALCAWLAGRAGGDLDLRRRFVELGYQYMPVAMISLVLGLGGGLFASFGWMGLDGTAVALVKGALFALSMLWSLSLGNRLLAAEGVPGSRRWLPLVPAFAGSLLIGAAWWPAIFGL